MPDTYKPLRQPIKKPTGTPGDVTGTPSAYYSIPDQVGKPYDIPGTPSTGPNALPNIKPEDLGYFGALL